MKDDWMGVQRIVGHSLWSLGGETGLTPTQRAQVDHTVAESSKSPGPATRGLGPSLPGPI